MLTTLRIKNLALVADLTLELQPGYNAITGETGAGKSIIIGALNLALGQRADRTLIRSGAESCAALPSIDSSSSRSRILSAAVFASGPVLPTGPTQPGQPLSHSQPAMRCCVLLNSS